MRLPLIVAATLLLVACGRSAPQNAAEDPTSSAHAPVPRAATATDFVESDYLGRWRGVEGMFLDVREGAAPGRYALEMQWDLDHRGRFDGRPTAGGLAFSRNGQQLILRRTDGMATGLKYLTGKRDCLTVAAGEGYCRD